jgi:hypothetical protein
MANVVYSSRVRIRVPFPIDSQDSAITSLNAYHDDSAPLTASAARTKCLDTQFQVVTIDVFDDGSRAIRAFASSGARP